MNNTAFVFPGQGSQTVGMLSDFIPHYSEVLDAFVEASNAVGYDLWDLIQNGPEQKLNQTEHTQVAMLTADVAIYRVLNERGYPMPRLMAGHSLGEYAALVCSEALSLTDAARLVARRGFLMQSTVPLGAGAMAAVVGLTDEQVTDLCVHACTDLETVSPANFNAIGQVVVAGHTAAVLRLIAFAEQAQARLAKLIPVSVPCHCPLLTDAAEQFVDALAAVSFKTPIIKVISNVDLSIYQSAEHIRERLKAQLYSPVRWVETIELFKKHNIEQVVECGPGKVLSGLIKRIDRTLSVISVCHATSVEQLMNQDSILV